MFNGRKGIVPVEATEIYYEDLEIEPQSAE